MQVQKEILDYNIEDHPEFSRQKIDYKKFVKRSALDTDYKNLIKQDFILRENGRPIIVYLHIEDIVSTEILDILKHLKFSTGPRTQGLRNRESRIFGYTPRLARRRDFCSATSFAYEDPKSHKTICDFGSLLSEYYKQYCPEMFNYHEAATKEKIKDEWIIKKSPFTSGIINKNNPLKYHFDTGNIRKVFSNMVCFRKDCEGGHLSIPEFSLGLEIADKTVLFFDGQSIMHGVTPFTIQSTKGYRFTMVYYTLDQMWHCDTIDEELARIKTLKTEREITRYKHLVGEPLTDDQKRRMQSVKTRHKVQRELILK